MPIIWRYLLVQYVKVLTFSVLAFVAILLTTRLNDIAHFATLGPDGKKILLFTLYQIPYILPIAIPVSALISSLLLIQRLSSSHELTALRAAGVSLANIVTPLLLMGAVIACLNFYIVSELTTRSHLSSSRLKSELRTINPLLLLNNKHLMRVKGFFFNAQGPSKLGEFAHDVEFATPDKENGRMNLLFAKELLADTTHFEGSGVTLLTSVGESQKEGVDEEGFDRVMIEHIGKVTTSIEDFTRLIEKKTWTLNHDHLPWKLLLTRVQQEKHLEKEALTLEEAAIHKRDIRRSYSEMARRLSVGAAVFCFTLMGIAFGIRIGRSRSFKGPLMITLLTSLYLTSFFLGKGLDHLFLPAAALYLAPLLLILLFSLVVMRRINRGIE